MFFSRNTYASNAQGSNGYAKNEIQQGNLHYTTSDLFRAPEKEREFIKMKYNLREQRKVAANFTSSVGYIFSSVTPVILNEILLTFTRQISN